jgi:UDP-N-acetyl-D-mannosaminuronic acid transferase (WecB/TagA/CpsF family)
MAVTFQSILGIKFFTGNLDELLGFCAGHFIVVPAAPALVDLPTDPAYREALEKSDFAITDSGFMVLLWKILTGRGLHRISGLKFLRGLLASEALKDKGSSCWIMPSIAEMEKNLSWFGARGVPVSRDDCFIPRHYPKGPLSDPELLQWIEAKKPPYVIVNLGGGVQERLGFYLRTNLTYRPAIICVGAAIAFITGVQANIPPWADRWMLGWFFRCLQAPGKFVPRYLKALRLVVILAKHRERSVAAE